MRGCDLRRFGRQDLQEVLIVRKRCKCLRRHNIYVSLGLDVQTRANLRLMYALGQDRQRTRKIRNGRKCITGNDLYMSSTRTYKGRTRSETGLGVVRPERPPRRGDSRGCTTTREFS